MDFLWMFLEPGFLYFVSGMLFSGAIGALIGARRRRALLGFLLGCLFGPLGWVFALFASDRGRKCPECLGAVNDGARRCCHCGAELGAAARAPSTVKCPYCSALLLSRNLKPGDNTCPKCREVFAVE